MAEKTKKRFNTLEKSQQEMSPPQGYRRIEPEEHSGFAGKNGRKIGKKLTEHMKLCVGNYKK